MNFQWSNIYVLQFLVALNVNGLKLVPADRTVIKQNGTTRTISRYFLFPHNKGENQENIDVASNSAEFSKFLRELKPEKDANSKNDKKESKKKTVDRYKIYIKRRIKKPKGKVQRNTTTSTTQDPDLDRTMPDSSSAEFTDNAIKRVTNQIPVHQYTTPTSENSEEEYTIKKIQKEIILYPNYNIIKRPNGKDTNADGFEDETIQYTNNSEEFEMQDSETKIEEQEGEDVIESKKVTTKKTIQPEGQLLSRINETPNKNLIQQEGIMPINYGDDETLQEETQKNTTSKQTIQPQIGGLNQTDLDQLYEELYTETKYKTYITNKTDNTDYKFLEDANSQEGYINLQKGGIKTKQQQKPVTVENYEFQKLLSYLRDTSESMPSQIVKKITGSNYYKNPTYGKESTDGKSSNAFYYDDLTNTEPVADFELTTPKLSRNNLIQNDELTPSSLENYYQLLETQNTHFIEPTLNVESIVSPLNVTTYKMPKSKPYTALGKDAKYSETKSNTLSTDNYQTEVNYLFHTTTSPYINYNINSSEYLKDSETSFQEYGQDNAEYYENIKKIQPQENYVTKYIKTSTYESYEPATTEPAIINSQTEIENPKYFIENLNPSTKHSVIVANPLLSGYYQQNVGNEEGHSFPGANRIDVESTTNNYNLYYHNNNNNLGSTEQSKSEKNVGFSQKDLTNVGIINHTLPLSSDEIKANKGYDLTNLKSSDYNEQNLEVLEALTSKPLGVNKSQIDFSKSAVHNDYSLVNIKPSNDSPENVEVQIVQLPVSSANNETDNKHIKDTSKLIEPRSHGYNQSEHELKVNKQNPVLIGDYQTEAEFKIKKPAYSTYIQANTEQVEAVINTTPQETAHTDVEYVDNNNNPPYLSNYEGEKTRNPAYTGNNYNTKVVKQSKPFVFTQASNEYSETTVTTRPSINQGDFDYSKTIRSPPILPTGYYQESTEYVDTDKNPFSVDYNSQNIDNSETLQSGMGGSNNNWQSQQKHSNSKTKPAYLAYTATEISKHAEYPYNLHNLGNNDPLEATAYPSDYSAYNGKYYHAQITKSEPYLNYDQATTEFTITVKNPSHIANYQESSENEETMSKAPLLKYNEDNNEDITPVLNPSQLSYNNVNQEYAESLINSASIDQSNSGYNQNPKILPYMINNKLHDIKYQNTGSPLHGVYYTSDNNNYHKKPRPPPYGIHQQSQNLQSNEHSFQNRPYQSSITELSKDPKHLHPLQSQIKKYSEKHIMPELAHYYPPSVINYDLNHHQTPSLGYKEKSKVPHSVQHSQKSNYYTNSINLPLNFPSSLGFSESTLHVLQNQSPNVKYYDNLGIPINHPPSTTYSENSWNLPHSAYNQPSSMDFSEYLSNPYYAINNQPQSTEYHAPLPIHNSQENNTNDSSQWNNDQQSTTDTYLSRKPKIEIGTSLLQTGNGNGAINHHSNYNKNINLASLCSECFKKITTTLTQKGLSGGKGEISVFELLNSLSPHHPLDKGRPLVEITPTSSDLSSENLQSYSIAELLKKSDSNNQDQQIYINPENNEILYKILINVLKAEASLHNKTATKIPNMDLFSIENLNKVLDAFKKSKLTETDKGTANFYKIIKLIFETAQKQRATTKGNAIWFTNLKAATGNPLKSYVYSLIQQTWLQEIMAQLINNNYNINVIRNPRWTAYLREWQMPSKLDNTNSDYFDQNEHMSFSIENLNKVLDAFKKSKLTETDKETANFYKIIKLIFEIAQKQRATTKGNAIWYTNLKAATGNPLKRYVYSLIQQTWLQEIMAQLINNNYNINVIRNPRWTAYLRKWQLPSNLENTSSDTFDQNEQMVQNPQASGVNLYKELSAIDLKDNTYSDYFDQNEHMLQNPQASGVNLYKELSAIDLKRDAGAILAVLQRHLLQAQMQHGRATVAYYQKQNEILTRISAFLRGRGYSVPVIQAFIRKLYAVFNSYLSQLQMTVPRPACVVGSGN